MRDSRPTPAYWQLDVLVLSLLLMIGILIMLDLPVAAFILAGLSFSGSALWVWENSDALAAEPMDRAHRRAVCPHDPTTTARTR